MNWQSSNSQPACLSAATSQASATFELSVIRLNIDSPQNTRSKPTPYRPPTNCRSLPVPNQTSIEWAWSSSCSAM